ncbi:MAG: hypothetical protein AAGJ35_10470 [Myxococcota bacterium]
MSVLQQPDGYYPRTMENGKFRLWLKEGGRSRLCQNYKLEFDTWEDAQAAADEANDLRLQELIHEDNDDE